MNSISADSRAGVEWDVIFWGAAEGELGRQRQAGSLSGV